MESYNTPAGEATARLIEKKSEFIGFCAPVQSEDAALAKLDSVRREHRTANHNVYAYVLREGARQRYSDDGEPAKTAGLPVLDAIGHAALSDCIVVVTRYFGGTLLGTGGLVRAYTGAAKAAIQAAGVSVVQPCVSLVLQIEYPLYEQAKRLVAEAGARVDAEDFTDLVTLKATMPQGGEGALGEVLRELCRKEPALAISLPFYAPFGL